MANFDEAELTNKLIRIRGESLEPSNSDKDSEIEWDASDIPEVSTGFGIVRTSKEPSNEINQYSESASDSELSCAKIVSSVSEPIQKSLKTCFDEQIMNFSAVNSACKPTHDENVRADNFCKNEVNKSKKNKEKDISTDSALQKMRILLEAYTESSSSSEMQLSPAVEATSSSQPNNCAVRTDFKNAICKETTELSEAVEESDCTSNLEPICLKSSTPEDIKPSIQEISRLPEDENVSVPAQGNVDNISPQTFIGPVFLPSLPEASVQPNMTDSQPEVKVEQVEKQPELPPQPAPVIPPTPRKRGRPRKQVLPTPVPVVEWPPGQEPKFEVPKEEKRVARAERRQAKRRKIDDGDTKEEKKRQRASQAGQKKKKRSTYVPKKKLASQRKKHSEMENIQNFEEETRMSASEGPTGFSSRSGALGDESQSGSMTAEGHTKSSINKKGRMEVGTDGCKPVTVQQIVEYYWPPASSLPYGEKSDALMIQEQICEYLGCKSFKRKYPSIKRRTVDMEERTYLQENGYVSENMCDMGLTAVLAADIMEIMYNDFPHKFEEYRKYSREKKVKEQRALREKQAAERADMDPKKEALESAQSWNSELNKSRSVKMEQSATKRKYNSQVLLGNWYEDNYNEEHKLAMYCKQKERRNLLIVKVRSLLENFLNYIPLTLRTSGLVYGDTILLMAPDVRANPYNSKEKGVVLAATIRSRDVERIQYLIDDLNIVGSPIHDPCNRNAFIIEPYGNKKIGDQVCYGDMFALKSAYASDLPLYVDLMSPSLTSPSGLCGYPNPTLKIGRSRNTRFRILHRNPHERFFIEGSPCPAFERIVISCASSNVSLCAEDEFWTLGFFSNECEISANTKVDQRNNPLKQNLWIFVGGFH